MSEIKFLEPVQIQTDKPYAKLRELSAQQGVAAEFIDFRLQEIFTYYTNEANKEPVEVKQDELGVFDDNELFIDPSLEISQSYLVEFYDLRKSPPPPMPKISIGVNGAVTKVIATVRKTGECPYTAGLERLMFEYISKQLLKAQILIGVRTGETKEKLLQIASQLRVKDEISEDTTIVVAVGVAPKSSTDARTIYYYKKKLENIGKEGKIDYASRGFLFGVSEGELIMEQIKSKDGKNGRDARGKFIAIPAPKDENGNEIKVSDNIERREDDESVKFIAKKAGYVSENKGFYDIAETLEVSQIDFKSTGSVQAGLDTNVTLVVKENDMIKDAIGPGVAVEADEVQVKGNIGPNAVVKANHVVIGGQTHGKSKIYAASADIAIHIGYAEGDEITIDRLEGGCVLAKKVRVKSVVGGQITAQSIQIETLGSNCTLTASSIIDVKYLRGTNNRFIIDASKMKDQTGEIDEQLAKIDALNVELERLPKILRTKKIIIDENKAPIYTIKQKIEELQKTKVVPPVTFMKKLKEYQDLVGEYNAILSDFNSKKDELAALKQELDVMQNGVFSAKIINRGGWIDLNEIRFTLVDPPKTVTYSTKQNETARVITLEKFEKADGETDFRIKKSNSLGDFEKVTF